MADYYQFRKSIAKKLYNLSPIVTDSSIVAITGAVGGGKTDYATSYISTLNKEVVEIVATSDLSGIIKDVVVWVDELDLFHSRFQIKLFKKVKEVGAILVFTYIYADDICKATLESSDKFTVPKLNKDGAQIISASLGEEIVIPDNFDGNVRKLIFSSFGWYTKGA